MASYPIIEISRNMALVVEPEFKDFDHTIIPGLFRSVDEHFSKAMGVPAFSSNFCLISYSDDIPHCVANKPIHQIYLHCSQNYWCKWMFQFAHEYCHHLIDVNVELKQGMEGLRWFEETICEMASMYHLGRMIEDWQDSGQYIKTHFVHSVREYLDDLLYPTTSTSSDKLLQVGLEEWSKWYILCYTQRSRPSSNAVAVKMLPIFEANPRLWRIILHFGDMRKWKSLDELFLHLRKVDSSYEAPLGKLQDLLFSL